MKHSIPEKVDDLGYSAKDGSRRSNQMRKEEIGGENTPVESIPQTRQQAIGTQAVLNHSATDRFTNRADHLNITKI